MAGLRRRQGTPVAPRTPGLPSWRRRPGTGVPGRGGGRRRRAGAAFPPISTLAASRSCVEAAAAAEAAAWAGTAARPAARMDDSQLFCVAEERSGHCAVVDGNFLYVWGGYVVRGRGGTGPPRVGSPRGVSDRADAGRPPTPAPQGAPRASPAPPLPAAPALIASSAARVSSPGPPPRSCPVALACPTLSQ